MAKWEQEELGHEGEQQTGEIAVVYVGKIIPISNKTTRTEPPIPPVCQVKGQKDTGDNNTIIKHGKGSIRF